MKYYSIAFNYPGPRANEPECSPAAIQALTRAEDTVFKVSRESKSMSAVHQYSWTDGSLFIWVRSKLSWEEVKEEFTSTLAQGGGSGVTVEYVGEVSSQKRTYKYSEGKELLLHQLWDNDTKGAKTLRVFDAKGA